MKKNKIEFLIILIISICLSVLLPNFFKKELTIVLPSAVDFAIWTLVIFAILSVFYFSNKPADRQNSLSVTNGYHELYNECNQITKKGFFEGGKLYNGSIYVYKKDGILSHIEIVKDGIYTGNVPINE